MPEVVQRALGALYRLLTMLVIFGGAIILGETQTDPIPALLVPVMWFTFCHMYLFPYSTFCTGFVQFFGRVGFYGITLFASTFSACFLWHLLYQPSPVAILHVLGLLIIHHCVSLLNQQKEKALLWLVYAVKLAVMHRSNFLLRDTPKPDTAAAEADGSGATKLDTASEATITAEPEQSAEPEQAGAETSDGPSTENVVEPNTRPRSGKKIFWPFLLGALKLALAALLTQIAINALFTSSVVNPAPMGTSTVLKPSVVVQANKPPIDIPIWVPAFATASGSPCQAAPTPTPASKSNWMAAMSTPMPTAMPQPTPSPMSTDLPKSQQVAVHDQALMLLDSLFNISVLNPKPLLQWYFSLPLATQYAFISLSLLSLWYFSKAVTIIAVHLPILVIGYLAAAALLPLLLSYGFTSRQSYNITRAAGVALSCVTWVCAYKLWNLGAVSGANAATLAQFSILFNDALARTNMRIDEKHETIRSFYTVFKKNEVRFSMLFKSENKQNNLINKHIDKIYDLRVDVRDLRVDVNSKADAGRTRSELALLSAKIDLLEASVADTPSLVSLQTRASTLELNFRSLGLGKADAADLSRLQVALKEINGRVDKVQDYMALASDIEDLNTRFDQVFDDVRDLKDFKLRFEENIAKLFPPEEDEAFPVGCVHCMNCEDDRHADAIEDLEERLDDEAERNADAIQKLDKRLDDEAKAAKKNHVDLRSAVTNDRKKGDERMSKLEKENTDLKDEVGELRGIVADMQKHMSAMADGQVKREDLQQLQDEVAADADLKINQLRSETDAKHDQATQAHNGLEASVNEKHDQATKAHSELKASVDARFAELTKEVSEFKTKTKSVIEGLMNNLPAEVNKIADSIWTHINERFGEVDKKIDLAHADTSKALKLVEAVEPGRGGWIAESQVDDYIRNKVKEFMEELMQKRLRGEVYQITGELLGREDIQAKIYANIMEMQALENTSPGIGPSSSRPAIEGPSHHDAATDNTTGTDDPLGEPPGEFPGGRAAGPGSGMPSNDTNTPTIPEESTTPDDVVDPHGTRGVPLGDPPGVSASGRAPGLGGPTSDASSGDEGESGPRPSGGADDGMLRPEQRMGKHPYTLERPENEQPGGEQHEETDEETEDDDDEEENEDAHNGGDDDGADDEGPPGPPPGSGGFHGHNGSGGGNDDDQGGDDDGAPGPPSGTGNSRGAPVLRSETGNSNGQNHASGGAHSKNGARRKPRKAYEDCTEREQKRRDGQWERFKTSKKGPKEENKEENDKKQQNQSEAIQDLPQPAQNQSPAHLHNLPREWQDQLSAAPDEPLRWTPELGQGQSQPRRAQKKPPHSSTQPKQGQSQPREGQNTREPLQQHPNRTQNQQSDDGQQQRKRGTRRRGNRGKKKNGQGSQDVEQVQDPTN